jgi:hypothetical protein
MPRMLAALVLLLALTVSGSTAPLAAAQDATPAAGRERLLAETMGSPELAITATADAYEGIPAETAAGRYVVTLTSAMGADASAGVEFLMLPEDVSFDDFLAMMTESMEGPPEWSYQTYLAGGLATDPESTSQGIFDLRPGTYVVWSGGDPEAAQPPVELTVTGEAATPAAATEPAAGATVTMFEYGFKVEGELTPGPQLLKVANVGAQPHFIVLVQPNEPVTKEQVGMVLDAEMAGYADGGCGGSGRRLQSRRVAVRRVCGDDLHGGDRVDRSGPGAGHLRPDLLRTRHRERHAARLPWHVRVGDDGTPTA